MLMSGMEIRLLYQLQRQKEIPLPIRGARNNVGHHVNGIFGKAAFEALVRCSSYIVTKLYRLVV